MFPLLAKLSLYLKEKGTGAVLGAAVICLVATHLLEPVSSLYASPVFRVFQVFSGMLIVQLPPLKAESRWKKNLIELLAVLFALLAYFCLLEKSVTLMDTAASVFLVYVLGQDWNGIVSRVLGCLPLRKLGKLSLPIFLIHGPVLFVWGRQLYKTLTCPHKGIVTGGICLLAILVLSVLYLLAQRLIKRCSKKTK